MVCSMQSENGKQKNSDLIWELDKLKQQQLAISFIHQLENRFCVFHRQFANFIRTTVFSFLSQRTCKWLFSLTLMLFMTPLAMLALMLPLQRVYILFQVI